MTTDEVRALIAAEKAATPKRMVLQTDWCRLCLGPLDAAAFDTCAACRQQEAQ